MSSGARLSQPLLRLTILAFVRCSAQAQLAPHQPKSPWKPEQLDCHQVLFQAGPGALRRQRAMGRGRDVHSSALPLLPSLDKYLLSAHSETGTMLGARDPAAALFPPRIGPYILEATARGDANGSHPTVKQQILLSPRGPDWRKGRERGGCKAWTRQVRTLPTKLLRPFYPRIPP